jgi:hypothetical protein
MPTTASEWPFEDGEVRNEPAAPVDAPRSQTRQRNSARIVVWVLSGFILGSLFWHFVGFWGFVSQVVLGGPNSATPAGPTVSMSAAPAGGPERAVAVSERSIGCVELALDRGTGKTLRQPCDASARALPLVEMSGKSDLAFLPSFAPNGGILTGALQSVPAED